MLDRIQFRKLDEGYTVRYYVPTEDPTKQRYAGEKFVTDIENLKICVSVLIDRFLETEPEPRK